MEYVIAFWFTRRVGCHLDLFVLLLFLLIWWGNNKSIVLILFYKIKLNISVELYYI